MGAQHISFMLPIRHAVLTAAAAKCILSTNFYRAYFTSIWIGNETKQFKIMKQVFTALFSMHKAREIKFSERGRGMYSVRLKGSGQVR